MKTKRAIYGFLAATLGSAILMVLGFFSTPLQLKYLGAERLGAYRAAVDLLGYLTLLDLGLRHSLSAVFSTGVAQNDTQKICEAIAAGRRAYRRTAIVGIFLTVGIAAAAPIFLRVAEELLVDLRIGILICATTWLSACFVPVQSLIEARQRSYLIQLAISSTALIGFGLTVGAAIAGWGIAGQFAASSVQSMIILGILVWIEIRSHPEEWPALLGRVAVPAGLWQRVMSLNWTGSIIGLAGRLALHSDNLIIGVVLGPQAVVPYFASQRLIQLAGSQALALGNVTWAGIADLFHRGQTTTFKRRLIEVTSYTTIIGLAGVVPSTIWARDFVGLWIGENYYSGILATGFAATAALTQTLASLWGWVFTGTGKISRMVNYAVFSAGVNIVFSVLATLLLGLPGPVIGTTFSFLLISTWWYPGLLKREFDIEPRELARAVALPIAAALFYFTPVAILAELFPFRQLVSSRLGGIVCLAGLLATTASGYLIFCWKAVLSRDNREEWLRIIRQALRTDRGLAP